VSLYTPVLGDRDTGRTAWTITLHCANPCGEVLGLRQHPLQRNRCPDVDKWLTSATSLGGELSAGKPVTFAPLVGLPGFEPGTS